MPFFKKIKIKTVNLIMFVHEGFLFSNGPFSAGFIDNLTHIIALLCSQVRQAEWYNLAGIGGVNGQLLLENLPEDLQRDIRRYLFKFVNKVSIILSKLRNMTNFLNAYCTNVVSQHGCSLKITSQYIQ
jgi:hypothetical protein